MKYICFLGINALFLIFYERHVKNILGAAPVQRAR